MTALSTRRNFFASGPVLNTGGGGGTGNVSPVFFADAATPLALPSCTYSSGVLTATVNGALVAQDGITLTAGQILLVKNQLYGLQNGLYTLTTVGDGSNPWVLTRTTGYTTSAEVYPSQIDILGGTSGQGDVFFQKTVNPTVGTDPLIYEISSSSSAFYTPLKFVDVVATTALPNSPSYSNGINVTYPAEDALYTATTNGTFPTLQGVTPYVGMQVLVTDEADETKNGDYILVLIGGVSAKWKLKRITYSSSGFFPVLWEVTKGTLQGYIYQQNNRTLINLTIGSAGNITFTQISPPSVGLPCDISFAVSDEITPLTVGTQKFTLAASPFAMNITEVLASLATVQTSGSIFTIDIKINGTTIFSTLLTIDNTEKDSHTAATPYVLSTTTIAKYDVIGVDIDQVGDGTAKALKLSIIGTRL